MIWLALALAAEPSEADLEQAFYLEDSGEMLFDQGLYERAVDAWTRSIELSGREHLWAEIAEAEERLGRHLEAVSALQRYRAVAPEAEHDELDQRIERLQKLMFNEGMPSEPEEGAEPDAPPPVPSEEPVDIAPRVRPLSVKLVGTAVGLGIAAAGIGTGLFVGELVSKKRDALTSRCVLIEEGLICPIQIEPELQVVRKRTAVADALVIVGIAGVGVAGAFQFGKGLRAAVGPRGLVVYGSF